MDWEVITVGKPWERTIPFSYAVATGDRLLVTAGVTARDPDGKVVAVGDIRGQIKQCFRNIWHRYFVGRPASTRAQGWCGGCAQNKDSPNFRRKRGVEFRRPDMLVEIEAIARLPEKQLP